MTDVIDLRESIECAVCGEALAIYGFNGDPSTLRCSECVAVSAATSVAGPVASSTVSSSNGASRPLASTSG